jgi:hypothetical protein
MMIKRVSSALIVQSCCRVDQSFQAPEEEEQNLKLARLKMMAVMMMMMLLLISEHLKTGQHLDV